MHRSIVPVASSLVLVASAAAEPSVSPHGGAPTSAGSELTLEPRYLRAAPAPDDWDDYSDRFRYRSTLSLWMPSVEGTVGKGAFEADVDLPFSDLFDKLTLAAGLNFEVGKGPVSVLVFGQYQHFEADAKTPRGFDADTCADFALVDIALAYQVLSRPGLAPGSGLSVELLGGARWTLLRAEVEIEEGPFAGLDEDREKNWFDPYVGGRVRYDFDRHWNVSVLGTGGGFGVGSDFAWSAYAQLEYRFSRRWSAVVGYRAVSYDYEDDGFIFDVTMHGPVIGIGIRM